MQKLIHSEKKHIFVLGCGGSGTGYMTKFLSLSGLGVGHEELKRDGCVSWTMVVDYITVSKEDRVLKKNFDHIFHQAKDPIGVINCFYTINDLDDHVWVFIRRFVPEIDRNDTLLVQCVKDWIYWNLMAEGEAEWRYKVEDLSNIFDEYCERINYLLNRDLLFSLLRNTHS